jgi:hypothetical protein
MTTFSARSRRSTTRFFLRLRLDLLLAAAASMSISRLLLLSIIVYQSILINFSLVSAHQNELESTLYSLNSVSHGRRTLAFHDRPSSLLRILPHTIRIPIE